MCGSNQANGRKTKRRVFSVSALPRCDAENLMSGAWFRGLLMSMSGVRRWKRWCDATFCRLGVMYQAQKPRSPTSEERVTAHCTSRKCLCSNPSLWQKNKKVGVMAWYEVRPKSAQHVAHLADVYVANRTDGRKEKQKRESVFRDCDTKVWGRELDLGCDVEFCWWWWMSEFLRCWWWCDAEFDWLGVGYQAQEPPSWFLGGDLGGM